MVLLGEYEVWLAMQLAPTADDNNPASGNITESTNKGETVYNTD